MTSRQPGPTRRTGRGLRGKPLLALLCGAACGAAGGLVVVQVAASSEDPVPVTQANALPGAYQPGPDPEQLGEPWTAPPRRAKPAPAVRDGVPTPGTKPGTKAGCGVDRLLVPSCGAWWGAAFTDWPQTTALRSFESKIGRPVAVYHTYYRGRKIFPGRTDLSIAREPGRRRLLMLNWKPDSGESWARVAAGSMDDHIDKLAAHWRQNFPERFWLAIHHEPENEVQDRPGSGFTATDYRNMFRHVVQRFRRAGVTNAIYTMVYMGYSGHVVKPWFKQLYPGNDVVDWIAYDPYADPSVKTFTHLVDRAAPAEQRSGLEGFYRWARSNLSDKKPLMLSEWGGSELSGNPLDKAELFRSMAREAKRFPALKAFLYWHSPNGHKFGDTRVDASPQALQAYREVSRMPYFNPPVPAG